VILIDLTLNPNPASELCMDGRPSLLSYSLHDGRGPTSSIARLTKEYIRLWYAVACINPPQHNDCILLRVSCALGWMVALLGIVPLCRPDSAIDAVTGAQVWTRRGEINYNSFWNSASNPLQRSVGVGLLNSPPKEGRGSLVRA
jgi:hypothetical protein